MLFSHLKEKNIDYFSHFCIAFQMSFLCLKASVKLFVHAVIPDFFETDGTKTISFVFNKYCKN